LARWRAQSAPNAGKRATIARGDYYQYDSRYATVCGKRLAAQAANL